MSKIQLDMYTYISERNAVRRISPDMVTGTHGCVCSGYEHEDHDVSIAMGGVEGVFHIRSPYL